MTRALLLLLGVLALIPAWVGAEEPTGFEEFPFGTSRSALVESPFRDRCRPAPEMQSAARTQGSRVTCPTYDLRELGPMRVTLLFSAEERLVGYVVFIPRDRQDSVRTRMEAIYGPPTREVERGRTIAWLWPSGAEASMTSMCRAADGCLTVKARATEKDAPPVTR